ncbi:rhomboid family intramembrane serine protease, partial [Coprococcus eutactus]|nr:rhomboid family intramembrane serine protease [Coprococcus eutactus]
MFTHFGITHLLGNMVFLIALGARIENIIGRLIYVIVYIVTGLAAAFASYIKFFCNDFFDYWAGA